MFNSVYWFEGASVRQASHLNDGPQSSRPQIRQALPSPWQLLPSDISQCCSGW